ncbi:MAG TPA: DUF6798 domain-containing protein [Kofleriaceae bacterium]|nr:DUF6798 domain-containing protein [Kofleriaceae bacterium]
MAVRAMTPRVRSGLVIAAVIGVGVAFALAYGDTFGAKNQQTYFLDVLVRAFPDLYRNDWFVTQNHHYHVVFAWLMAPLYAIDPDGPVVFGIAQIVTMVAMFGAIYSLIAAVTERSRLAIFIGIVGLLVLGGGRALGGSYLYSDYLQPSSFATLGWLVAMNLWIRDRVLLAGIALALGAAFHLNYALLGIGMFAMAELAARRFDWRRIALLVGPSLVVVACFLPTMIHASRSTHDAHALDLLVRFIFPNHFKPSRVRLELLALVGWHLIALALRPDGDDRPAVRLFWFGTVVMGTCILVTSLVQIPPLLTFTRLFVWRVAPLGILVAQLLLFSHIRAFARGDQPRPHGWQLACLVVGAGLIIVNAFSRPRGIYPEVITIVFAAAAVTIAVRREWLATVMCAVLCVYPLWTERAHLTSPILFMTGEASVTRWARTSTPRDAVFLTPPYAGEFRLLARRAVIVDDKSPPMYLDELIAWHQRLSASVGARSAASLQDVWHRWDTLSGDELVAIANSFHADYVVLDKSRSTATLPAPIAFEDPYNIVYAIAH